MKKLSFAFFPCSLPSFFLVLPFTYSSTSLHSVCLSIWKSLLHDLYYASDSNHPSGHVPRNLQSGGGSYAHHPQASTAASAKDRRRRPTTEEASEHSSELDPLEVRKGRSVRADIIYQNDIEDPYFLNRRRHFDLVELPNGVRLGQLRTPRSGRSTPQHYGSLPTTMSDCYGQTTGLYKKYKSGSSHSALRTAARLRRSTGVLNQLQHHGHYQQQHQQQQQQQLTSAAALNSYLRRENDGGSSRTVYDSGQRSKNGKKVGMF